MLTAENRTNFSARLKTGENAKVTAFLEHYQTENGIEFTSFRDFLMHLVDNESIFIETDVQPKGEYIEVEKIKPNLKAFAEENDLPIESTALEIVTASLGQQLIKTVEVEKEVIKEVPISITENQLLLDLDEKQNEVLKEINSNRNKALIEEDHPTEPIEQTAKGLMFNKATLNNWGEEFWTGFS